MRTRALLFAVVLLGCGDASTDDASDTAGEALIGAVKDTGDPAIVELVYDVGQDSGSCTATFLSTTVLLTAAHCIEAHATHYRIMTAPSESAATAASYLPVQSVHRHPRYDGDIAHDVAIVVLAAPHAVTPIPLYRSPVDATSFGRSVRIVGYGQAVRRSGPNDGSGTKRSVRTTLRGAQDGLLHIGTTGHQACEGDSGGPALLTVNGVEMLIGTDDVGASSVDCTGGDLYQRIDRQLDFIDAYLH